MMLLLSSEIPEASQLFKTTMINYDSDLLDSVNAKLQPIGLASLSNQALLQIIPYAANRYKILEATLTFIQASEQFQNVVRVFEGDGVGGLYVFCLVGWQGGASGLL